MNIEFKNVENISGPINIFILEGKINNIKKKLYYLEMFIIMNQILQCVMIQIVLQ